jgi:DNA-binding response OmpR family regulator
VSLPVAVGEAAPAIPSPRVTPERGSETILLVDDSTEVLQFAAGGLERLGYTVLSASNAQGAIELASSFDSPIDLLILDLVLPDGNGRDVARRLTALRPGLAVLFVSGYPNSDPDVLPKPFNLDALGVRVQEVLRRRYYRRLLVIDDDPALAAFAKGVLSNAGFEVHTAENGSGAVACVREHAIDLVITDLIMPESEGLETIRNLRQEYPELPIIATSGAFGGHFLRHALKFGVQAVIHKPFSAADLLNVVKSTLGIGARIRARTNSR